MSHPCFTKAIDMAAKYMGNAIHSIMTIMNPNEIVIGGAAIDQIPGFYEKMIETARDLCWKNCWNCTYIRATSDVRSSQIIGATMLYMGAV